MNSDVCLHFTQRENDAKRHTNWKLHAVDETYFRYSTCWFITKPNFQILVLQILVSTGEHVYLCFLVQEIPNAFACVHCNGLGGIVNFHVRNSFLVLKQSICRKMYDKNLLVVLRRMIDLQKATWPSGRLPRADCRQAYYVVFSIHGRV